MVDYGVGDKDYIMNSEDRATWEDSEFGPKDNHYSF